jgi:hypothetical protein
VKAEQVVRVAFPDGSRQYTYMWRFDPFTAGPLAAGDLVRVPPTSVSDEPQVCVVVALGSDYDGEMKEIIERVER